MVVAVSCPHIVCIIKFTINHVISLVLPITGSKSTHPGAVPVKSNHVVIGDEADNEAGEGGGAFTAYSHGITSTEGTLRAKT